MRRSGVGVLLMLVLSVAFAAACGDDDECRIRPRRIRPPRRVPSRRSARMPISWRATCPRSRRSSYPGDGTDAVTAQIDAIKSDLSTLKSSAADARIHRDQRLRDLVGRPRIGGELDLRRSDRVERRCGGDRDRSGGLDGQRRRQHARQRLLATSEHGSRSPLTTPGSQNMLVRVPGAGVEPTCAEAPEGFKSQLDGGGGWSRVVPGRSNQGLCAAPDPASDAS